jgi:glutamate N-acetyltransferase/amino-acid N-acetyltransferase
VSVTAATGFRASGVGAGIKAGGALDLALVVNDGPSHAVAAVFTANRVKAAPVLWSEQVVSDGVARAVVLNSGGANACTGPPGFADAHRTAEEVGSRLGVGAGDVIVCSTGLIGERLPMDAVSAGIVAAADALDVAGGGDAATAILTTDTKAKTAVVRHPDGWCIGGMAKGAGMLAPGLATMLCVLTTDAVVAEAELARALRAAVRTTFDRLDSDGCMSTNDTVVLMSSGASGASADPDQFGVALTEVCRQIVRQLLADAEGATKEITIEVTTAASQDDAVEVGRSIARNNLLKCALYGNDPNWGRVLAAIGTTSAAFEPDAIDVSMNGVAVCTGGAAGVDRSLVDLSGRCITIAVDLHAGSESATILTNDLSHAYVEENSAYSS